MNMSRYGIRRPASSRNTAIRAAILALALSNARNLQISPNFSM